MEHMHSETSREDMRLKRGIVSKCFRLRDQQNPKRQRIVLEHYPKDLGTLDCTCKAQNMILHRDEWSPIPWPSTGSCH